jgi:hypothetical protein
MECKISLPCSQASSTGLYIESHIISPKLILILCFRLCFGFQVDHFPSNFPTKISHSFLFHISTYSLKSKYVFNFKKSLLSLHMHSLPGTCLLNSHLATRVSSATLFGLVRTDTQTLTPQSCLIAYLYFSKQRKQADTGVI